MRSIERYLSHSITNHSSTFSSSSSYGLLESLGSIPSFLEENPLSLPTLSKSLFNSFDTNGDKFLSDDELKCTLPTATATASSLGKAGITDDAKNATIEFAMCVVTALSKERLINAIFRMTDTDSNDMADVQEMSSVIIDTARYIYDFSLKLLIFSLSNGTGNGDLMFDRFNVKPISKDNIYALPESFIYNFTNYFSDNINGLVDFGFKNIDFDGDGSIDELDAQSWLNHALEIYGSDDAIAKFRDASTSIALEAFTDYGAGISLSNVKYMHTIAKTLATTYAMFSKFIPKQFNPFIKKAHGEYFDDIISSLFFSDNNGFGLGADFDVETISSLFFFEDYGRGRGIDRGYDDWLHTFQRENLEQWQDWQQESYSSLVFKMDSYFNNKSIYIGGDYNKSRDKVEFEKNPTLGYALFDEAIWESLNYISAGILAEYPQYAIIAKFLQQNKVALPLISRGLYRIIDKNSDGEISHDELVYSWLFKLKYLMASHTGGDTTHFNASLTNGNILTGIIAETLVKKYKRSPFAIVYDVFTLFDDNCDGKVDVHDIVTHSVELAENFYSFACKALKFDNAGSRILSNKFSQLPFGFKTLARWKVSIALWDQRSKMNTIISDHFKSLFPSHVIQPLFDSFDYNRDSVVSLSDLKDWFNLILDTSASKDSSARRAIDDAIFSKMRYIISNNFLRNVLKLKGEFFGGTDGVYSTDVDFAREAMSIFKSSQIYTTDADLVEDVTSFISSSYAELMSYCDKIKGFRVKMFPWGKNTERLLENNESIVLARLEKDISEMKLKLDKILALLQK